jgi:hypothetical protein
MSFRSVRCIPLLLCARLVIAAPAPSSQPAPLPESTSRYNRGDFPGRYRDDRRAVRRFELKRESALYDGGGREIGKVRKPLMLNEGAVKEMDLDGVPGLESYAWAWQTEAGSGWIARDALVKPPPPDEDPQRNPRPPGESPTPLVINAAEGTRKLAGLRHVNSQGVLPPGGGNSGGHYAGRNPGPRDYIYLLFAVPNVQRGGTARDSLPDGSKFIPALDEHGQPIAETMTMYRDKKIDQPVRVTFIYGRAEGGKGWGWIARANVGEL